MKLLFDENLPPRLVALLADLFPGSAHVREIGMASARDSSIWEHARAHDFVIVSKDEDFHHLSFLRGAPPKVIGLQTGNTSTAQLATLLRSHAAEIGRFCADDSAAFMTLP